MVDMASKVSMRLSEGMYLAVKELAIQTRTGISDMAQLLLLTGLGAVKSEKFSQRTMELMQADMMEAAAKLIRLVAKLAPAEREEFEKEFAEVIQGFEDLMQVGERKVEGEGQEVEQSRGD